MNAKIFFTVATALIAIASAASAVAGDNSRPVNVENAFEISAPSPPLPIAPAFVSAPSSQRATAAS